MGRCEAQDNELRLLFLLFFDSCLVTPHGNSSISACIVEGRNVLVGRNNQTKKAGGPRRSGGASANVVNCELRYELLEFSFWNSPRTGCKLAPEYSDTKNRTVGKLMHSKLAKLGWNLSV